MTPEEISWVPRALLGEKKLIQLGYTAKDYYKMRVRLGYDEKMPKRP